jgi:hypothetical protein
MTGFRPRGWLTNQCTRIAIARFYIGYLLAKKWVSVATIASPQSRNFKRWVAGDNNEYR